MDLNVEVKPISIFAAKPRYSAGEQLMKIITMLKSNCDSYNIRRVPLTLLLL